MDPIFFYKESQSATGTKAQSGVGDGDLAGAAGPGAASDGDGGLRGLRVALQPNISVRGWPTDAGSRALADFTALEDATVVRRSS
jgi:Asp-tRNA(Asn)/Glu-tRNA(Gln) amidotransferase A subunit family amidase